MFLSRGSMDHLDDETLRLFAVGRLHEGQGDGIEAHLAQCESCVHRLDEIERKLSDPFVRELKVAGVADPSGGQWFGVKRSLFLLCMLNDRIVRYFSY